MKILKRGDKAGIAACSNPLKNSKREELEELKKVLIDMGLVPVFSDFIFEDTSLPCCGAQRAEALMKLYRDPEVKVIFDVSGGDMADETLSFLSDEDLKEIARSEKIIFGYSDLSVMVNGISAATGLPSVLYQIRNLLYDHGDRQRRDFQKTFFEDDDSLFRFDYQMLQGSRADFEQILKNDPVIGGNIRCFLKLAGTSYMPDFRSKLLFLEAYSGRVPQMISHLSQLKIMGAFEQVDAILLGTFTEMEHTKDKPDIQILVRTFAGPDLPIAYTGQIGHGTDSKALLIRAAKKPKFVFAPDSFKGSLSAERQCELLEQAANVVFDAPDCISVPMADGGEGTRDVLVRALHGNMIETTVSDPLGRPVRAAYAQLGAFSEEAHRSTLRSATCSTFQSIFQPTFQSEVCSTLPGRTAEGTALIEMAAASGLPLLKEEERDPFRATSKGTGELILHALNAGFRDVVIAIGGSATNDGGTGCLCALGVKFYDKNGTLLEGRGETLGRIDRIDLSSLDPRIRDTHFTVMCDVDNPLCGKNGATYTFGRQKGADEKTLQILEAGMEQYRRQIMQTCKKDPDTIPGAGAAGGMGAALSLFLGAELKSGVETVLDLIKFNELIKDADLIITGEGRTDAQSVHGKVLQGVGARCKKYGVPALALSGSLGEGADEIFQEGICSAITTVSAPMTLEAAIADAEDLYYEAALRLFRLWDAC